MSAGPGSEGSRSAGPSVRASPRSRAQAHSRPHTYARARARTHTHSHSNSHVRPHLHMYMCLHSHSHVLALARTRTLTRARTDTHTHAPSRRPSDRLPDDGRTDSLFLSSPSDDARGSPELPSGPRATRGAPLTAPTPGAQRSSGTGHAWRRGSQGRTPRPRPARTEGERGTRWPS